MPDPCRTSHARRRMGTVPRAQRGRTGPCAGPAFALDLEGLPLASRVARRGALVPRDLGPAAVCHLGRGRIRAAGPLVSRQGRRPAAVAARVPHADLQEERQQHLRLRHARARRPTHLPHLVHSRTISGAGAEAVGRQRGLAPRPWLLRRRTRLWRLANRRRPTGDSDQRAEWPQQRDRSRRCHRPATLADPASSGEGRLFHPLPVQNARRPASTDRHQLAPTVSAASICRRARPYGNCPCSPIAWWARRWSPAD